MPPRARAIAVVFAANGLGVPSFLARLPERQADLGLSDGELGLALVGLSLGALVASPLAGRLVGTLASRRLVLAAGVTLGGCLWLAGAAGNAVVLLGALAVVGAADAAMDIAMNANGAAFEDRSERSVMHRLHGAWSVGALAAAAVAGLTAAASVPLTAHLAAVGALVAAAVLVSRPGLVPGRPTAGSSASSTAVVTPESRLPRPLADVADPTGVDSGDSGPPRHVADPADVDSGESGPPGPSTDVADPADVDLRESGPPRLARGSEGVDSDESGRPGPSTGSATVDARERRPSRRGWARWPLVALAAATVGGAVIEGAPTDWSAVQLERYGTSHGVAALGVAAFMAGMFAGRLVGDWLTDRLGGALVLRLGTALVAAGIVVGALAGHPAAFLAGLVVAGVGASGFFPLAFSAAARTPGVSPGAGAATVSLAARVGFLAEPVLMGAVAEAIGLRWAFGLVAASAVALAWAAPRIIPPTTRPAPVAPTDPRTP